MLTSVTYTPATVGPYFWQEFDEPTVARDFAGIKALGIDIVRVGLSWDAFLSSPREVNRRRLRDFEALLKIAVANDLKVVPIVGPQTVGDCIFLPRYAVLSDRPRPDVRVVCESAVEPGGPRDLYTDPLMLEVQLRGLETLIGGFGSHPAIAAWDLGQDPASTVRPIRIAHLAAWCQQMASTIKASGDQCWMTLGSADILTARGVRLSAVAPHVDVLQIDVRPERLDFCAPEQRGEATAFVLSLAQQLAGPTALGVNLTLPQESASVGSNVNQIFEAATAVGSQMVAISAWSNFGERLIDAAPFDRDPTLRNSGVVNLDKELTTVGAALQSFVKRDSSIEPAHPWPTDLNVEDYYAHLPDSVADLWSRWPAILG